MCLGFVGYSYAVILRVQLRESIAQDQERTESSKVQMSELESSVQKVDAEVHTKEMMLKDLRKIQDQVSRKTAERSTLFKEQQRQYAALPEENEGFLFYYHHAHPFAIFFFFLWGWVFHLGGQLSLSFVLLTDCVPELYEFILAVD